MNCRLKSAPALPTAEEKLLVEIRDLLAAQNKADDKEPVTNAEWYIDVTAKAAGNTAAFFVLYRYAKATPHKDCGTDTQSDFLSDCLNLPQEY